MNTLKYIKSAFVFSLVIVAILFIIGQLALPSERETIELQCNEFSAEWELIDDNGERTPVEVPGKVDAERGKEVKLATVLPEDIDETGVLAFRTKWQDAKIYIGNELRAEYSTKDSRPFGKNSTFRYVFVELKEGDAGKELTYYLTTGTKYSDSIQTVYIGDKVDIMLQLFASANNVSIPATLLFMISLFGVAVCTFLRAVYNKHLTIGYLLIAMLLCSVWMISETEFRQVMFNNISTVACLTYISIMLISVPFVLFINEVQNERYSKLFSVPLAYNMLAFITAMVLQVFNIAEFVDMLPFSHAGIILASVCIIITIISDIKNHKISEYKYISIGILGLVASTFLEIILYYMNFTTTIGVALVVGLMFLLLMAIIKTGQDIMETEKKKHEAIMAKEAQSNFLANMSHEIRTPINAIIGMNEMVLRESTNENVIEYSNAIRSSSQSLLAIINDVLDISKIESGKMEIVESDYELSVLIADCYNMVIERVREKNLTLHIDCNEQSPSVLYGDVSHIRQVILNLLTNAVKYTEKGDIYLRINGEIRNGQWLLSVVVADTGIGIAKENLNKLFVKFERFDLQKNRNVEGTGLGLNIVQSFVELMNGTITAESEYGKGSVFTICIPQKIVDPTPVGKLNTASIAPDKTGIKHNCNFVAPQAKILVVDDVSTNLNVFVNLIKHYKMQIDTALSGQEALTFTEKKKYDIIFMDHMMPEMDGIETLGRIKSAPDNPNEAAPIIMLTANALIGMKEMYLEAGFTDYLSKPIIPEKLEQMIEQYLPDEKKITETDEDSAIIPTQSPAENSDDNSSPLDKLKSLIHDVDTEKALLYCAGSEEMYIEFLKEYAAKERTEHISESYQKMDLKQYAIEVHTLKSTSRTLGFSKLGDYAERLQFAAEQNNMDEINAVHADMLKLYKEILTALNKFFV